MKLMGFIATLILAGAATATPPPNLELLEKEWGEALAGWRDTQVEADRVLFTRPAPEALQQIDEAALCRRRLTAAKQRYVAALATHYRAAARDWTAPAAGAAEPASEAGLRTAMGQWEARLTGQARTVPASARDNEMTLRKQMEEVQAIQASLRQRQQARQRAGFSPGAAVGEAAPAAEAMLALANRLENHEAALKREGDAWEQVYQGLRQEVERRNPRAVEPAPAQTTGVLPQEMSAVAAGQAVVPSIAGVWFLQNLNARKTDDGAYEPKFVNVRITQQDDNVQGSYEGVYAVPEDEPFNPTVRFSFEGRITTEIMRFPLRAPLRGSIEIQRVNPFRIRVSYTIENPEQRNISFGVVPADNPQLLQKKID